MRACKRRRPNCLIPFNDRHIHERVSSMINAREIRTLPRSGLKLTALGLGCSQLGGLYRPISWSDAQALVDAAWSEGLRYFDTAPYYGYTLSERRVGQALAIHGRDDFVGSTKVGRLMSPDASVQR